MTKNKKVARIRARDARSTISAERRDLEATLSSLFGFDTDGASFSPRYSNNARIIECTQELTVVGKRGTADMYAQAVCLSANPFSPIMSVYRNAAGSSEFYDFGQMDENGVDQSGVAFSNLAGDDGTGTLFERYGTTVAGLFRGFYPRFKSINCVGGHCEVVGYGTITNTEGFIRTFEAENRALWSLGDANQLITVSRDPNAIRVPGYQVISAYSLNEQNGGGMLFPIVPTSNNDAQHDVASITCPSASKMGSWNPSTTPLYTVDLGCVATALNPVGLNQSSGFQFDGGEDYAEITWNDYVPTARGLCDPDFDLRFFDVSALSDGTKLRFTVKLYFIVEPYVTQLSAFPSPGRTLRMNEKERSVALRMASAIRAHGGDRKAAWERVIASMADAGSALLVGRDGRFDLGDAFRLGSNALAIGYGTATGNPVPLLTGVGGLARPLLYR